MRDLGVLPPAQAVHRPSFVDEERRLADITGLANASAQDAEVLHLLVQVEREAARVLDPRPSGVRPSV